MTRHTVLSPLRHDGQTYAEGDTVELTSEQAQSLMIIGVVGDPVGEILAQNADEQPTNAPAAPRKRGKRAA